MLIMQQNLTYNDLPTAVTNLTKEVNEIKSLLTQKQEQTINEQSEKWLDLNDLVQYDPEKRTKQTWYSKLHKNEVPHYKRDKKVYFLKTEIDFRSAKATKDKQGGFFLKIGNAKNMYRMAEFNCCVASEFQLR